MSSPDAARLEALWSGKFGDTYTERNEAAGEGRRRVWRTILDEFPAARVLEVGCNLGANLRWIVSEGASGAVCGVDVSNMPIPKISAKTMTARMSLVDMAVTILLGIIARTASTPIGLSA